MPTNIVAGHPAKFRLSKDCPIASLSKIWPDGIPVRSEVSIGGQDFYELPLEAVPEAEEDLLVFAAAIASHPAFLKNFCKHGFFAIPTEWGCAA